MIEENSSENKPGLDEEKKPELNKSNELKDQGLSTNFGFVYEFDTDKLAGK